MGEWAFHWGQLLDPAAAQSTPTGYLDLPSYWNDVRIQGHPIGGTGCATLSLRILPGPGHEPLALRVFDLSSAYRLWVDGRLVASGGRVGRSANGTVPRSASGCTVCCGWGRSWVRTPANG
jgi:two-component system sensor histidine kinase ChiS